MLKPGSCESKGCLVLLNHRSVEASSSPGFLIVIKSRSSKVELFNLPFSESLGTTNLIDNVHLGAICLGLYYKCLESRKILWCLFSKERHLVHRKSSIWFSNFLFLTLDFFVGDING